MLMHIFDRISIGGNLSLLGDGRYFRVRRCLHRGFEVSVSRRGEGYVTGLRN
jgi:hypothetical protein